MKSLINRLLIWAGIKHQTEVKTSRRKIIRVKRLIQSEGSRRKLTDAISIDALRAMTIGDEIIFLFEDQNIFAARCKALHSNALHAHGKSSVRTRRSFDDLSISITRIA